ncbi:MAG: hypothetical protein IT373_20495 [Polyangiaceae bacterium]|nr:hypothetical protein [Polyangiaceae bacterium]
MPTPAGPAPAPGATGAERTGRRVGRAVHLAICGAVGLAATVQLTTQVFFHGPHGEAPYPDCRHGVRALYVAIQRGRAEADDAVVSTADEAALVRFREAVALDWQYLDAVRDLCRGRGEVEEGALTLVERLRYAEEHGVRSAAVELATLRRQAQNLVDEVLGDALPAHDPPAR